MSFHDKFRVSPCPALPTLVRVNDHLVATTTPEGGVDHVAPLAGLRYRVRCTGVDGGDWLVVVEYGGWAVRLYPPGPASKDESLACAAAVSRWIATQIARHG